MSPKRRPRRDPRESAKGPPPATAAQPSRRGTSWCAALIVAVGLAAYAPSLSGVFLFDDPSSIANNRNIRSLWPLTDAMAAPPAVTLSARPVASLTFAIDYARTPAAVRDVFAPAPRHAPANLEAYERNLRTYHTTNLAIHLLAGLALFGIVRRTLSTPSLAERFGAASRELALIVALIWIAHPLQTSAVTYIVQRVESLMGLFYLLTLYCSIRAHENSRRLWWSIAATVCCALGMGSKEVMVTAPLLVVLWDVLFAAPARARVPLYLGLCVTWAVFPLAGTFTARTASVGFGFEGWSWATYLATQAGVVTHYLRLALVPYPLVFDYEWPAAASIVSTAPQSILLLALLALTLIALVTRQPIGYAGAAFFLMLAPTSSVLPIVTEVAAEHRMYLPLAAVVCVAVLAGHVLAKRLPRSGWNVGIARIAVVIAVIATLVTLTRDRNVDYQSEEGIWADTVRKRPSNARARHNYATVLLASERVHQAEEHLRVAVRINPRYAEAETALGAALAAQGRFDEAMRHLRRAIELQPDYREAHQNLGEAYASRRDLASAVRHYQRALELKPDDVFLMNRIGWILATSADGALRDGSRAADLGERAVRLTGRGDVDSLDTLAAAYAELGRFSDAIAIAREALTLARAKKVATILPELEQRLSLYESEQPFREE